MIVAHNRPSGDPAPRPDDMAIVQRLRQALAMSGSSC
jgi:DNA repair protein RadC